MASRIGCWVTWVVIVLAACSGTEGTGPQQPPPDNPPPPPPEPPPTGISLSLTLSAGAYWQFFWTSESENFAQGSGTEFDVKVGKFRVTLGSPTPIGGLQAFPLTVAGASSDGTVDFRPEWTHLAVAANGSLMGSADGATLKLVYDSRNNTWKGGGFFVPFPVDQTLTAASSSFPGIYNQLPSVVVGRQQSSGGCTYYPSVNETICSGDPTSLSENEYYKPGIGPLGYVFTSAATFTGGGFTTVHKRKRTVELIETSFTAADGSVLRKPAWDEVASLNTPRQRHAAVVLQGKIYVIGGHDGTAPLTSVEIYDPVADRWSAGAPLPQPGGGGVAEVVGNQIYLVQSGKPIYVFDPAQNTWTTGPTANFTDPSYDGCPMLDDYIVLASPGGPGLNVPLYRRSANQWLFGTPYSTTERRWSAVACIGTDMYIVGGFHSFLDSKVTGSALRYDAVNGVWQGLAGGLNDVRYDARAVNLNGEIVVLGGRDLAKDLRSVEALSPASGSWRRLHSMFRPRYDFDAVVLGGKIYVIGGASGTSTLANVEVYTPQP